MANRARGEVTLECEGRALTLCLTLGALAEIEDVLGAAPGGMGRLKASDVLAVLRALLKGGGEVEAAARVETLKVDLSAAARAISAAFAAAA